MALLLEQHCVSNGCWGVSSCGPAACDTGQRGRGSAYLAQVLLTGLAAIYGAYPSQEST